MQLEREKKKWHEVGEGLWVWRWARRGSGRGTRSRRIERE